ncbi:hypothetical protein GCM10008955_24800 [Deinococcus malanensis]|uniref:Uncharacterized protein n=1 Tax=Deinococcus malanensis TaxID=1706855 RepID=A0ABQ2EY09_9DEIO|nr:hypothetical protein GCM10008955_24800 [Deinococcus malanensis]
MRETGLKLAVAHLLVSGLTFVAAPAAGDERHGDAVACSPFADVPTHSDHSPREFMARNMWQGDVRVMPHPPVPVAAAHAGGLHLHHHAIFRGNGIRDRGELRANVERVNHDGLHGATVAGTWTPDVET